jgi:hypothetical protein
MLANPATNLPLGIVRESLIAALVLNELEHAPTQQLGVPLPHSLTGDHRLRMLCCAHPLNAPRSANGRVTWAPANAPSPGCFAASWAPVSSNGANRSCWQGPSRCWPAVPRSVRSRQPAVMPATALSRPCSSKPWDSRQVPSGAEAGCCAHSADTAKRRCPSAVHHLQASPTCSQRGRAPGW